jgi:hypothetical protein
MSFDLATLIFIIVLLEVSFVSHSIFRLKFTKRLESNHRDVFVTLGSPPKTLSGFSESLREQNALIAQAKFIIKSHYKELHDPKICFLGNCLRNLFWVQVTLGIWFSYTTCRLFIA